MDKEKIITLEQMKKDPLLEALVFNRAAECNLDVEKVYEKLSKVFLDYRDTDAEYVNRRLPEMMSDFIWGYLMCYNPHVKYKSKSLFEKN